MYRGMYTYAWDLAAEGVAEVAARLEGAGLNTVTLATSYHAGRFLRPHGPGSKVYVPEDGTVYFQPNTARYGRLKPRVNSLVAEFDALRELEKQAPNLNRVGWTVCLHNTPLGTENPDLVARNAYGDPYFHSLCPSHGDVRAYLTALCADMGDTYALSGLALETPGWLPYTHGHHHEFALVASNPWIETLLGLCFCESCTHGAGEAGIDVSDLRRQARGAIDAFLESDIAPSNSAAQEWWTMDMVSNPEWAAFLQWRCRVVADLVHEIRAELNPEIELSVVPTVQSPNALAWREGSDLRLLADAADALEVPAYQTGVTAIRNDAWDVRRRLGADAKVNFILRPSYPNLFSAEDVAGAVKALDATGMAGIAFYNYGHCRLSALEWIEGALAGLD